MIEYKGYFSTVNRLENGHYVGVVTGLQPSGVEIRAASICSLRKKFETVVDEFLQHTSPQSTFGLVAGDSSSRVN